MINMTLASLFTISMAMIMGGLALGLDLVAGWGTVSLVLYLCTVALGG